jgi:predicted DNA-binding protein with PD1-like motif
MEEKKVMIGAQTYELWFETTIEEATSCFGSPFPITSLEGKNFNDTPSVHVHGVSSETNSEEA